MAQRAVFVTALDPRPRKFPSRFVLLDNLVTFLAVTHRLYKIQFPKYVQSTDSLVSYDFINSQKIRVIPKDG